MQIISNASGTHCLELPEQTGTHYTTLLQRDTLLRTAGVKCASTSCCFPSLPPRMILDRIPVDLSDDEGSVEPEELMDLESSHTSIATPLPPSSASQSHTPTTAGHAHSSLDLTPTTDVLLARQSSEVIGGSALVGVERLGASLMRSQSVQVVSPSRGGGGGTLLMPNKEVGGAGDVPGGRVKSTPKRKRLDKQFN